MPQPSERQQQASSCCMYEAQIEDSRTTYRVVVGIILIFGIRVRAIFDTFASHSFVGRAFASLHELGIGPLLHAREVQISDHIL